IGPAATVGPFSFLRPGTVLGESGKLGAFVETKNATIGAHSYLFHPWVRYNIRLAAHAKPCYHPNSH
ncbi:hypothetical protein, partial [Nocardia cyriacigeorgica]|uniref:hypothetical protein n=1 Tax=Nocardia cyriacigeorgica TaxID=135487 RepID=UPI002456E19D